MTSKTNRLVRVVPEADWRGFIAWNTGSDNREKVFDARVFDAHTKTDITVCIKLYPGEDGKNRGMVNEITGWLLAQALNIPQPDHAYVVKVPLKALVAPVPSWVKVLKKEVTHYWAFATKKLPADSAAIKFNQADLPLLVDDICRWKHLPSAVALDEHIANTDRHLNNLLRIGKANYALIDNGRLAVEDGDRNWAKSDLDADWHYSNLLSQQCWNDNPDTADSSQTLSACSKHADALIQVREELEDWWRRLILDPAERSAFNKFISDRSASLSILIGKRYRALPV